MTKRVVLAVLALGVAGVAAYGVFRLTASRMPEARRPNVVLIEVCSLRADRLGCMGYGRDTSPTIDALAESGALFQSCISASSWTKPSTASILTGLTPNAHQLTDYYSGDEIQRNDFAPKRVLSPNVVTLAEALQTAGYQTGAFVANVHAWPAFGFDQGFDHFQYADGLNGPRLAEGFSEWLAEADAEQPFFAFLLFFDVHHPYSPPYAYYRHFNREESDVELRTYKPYSLALHRRFLPDPKLDQIGPGDQERWSDLYDGAVRVVDDSIARLLRALHDYGFADDTSVILVSDHGDLHMEHNMTNHGNSLAQELVHVPLIISAPGRVHPGIVQDVVSTIDVLPTVCDICGIAPPEYIQGRSLLPHVTEADVTAETPAYAFSTLFGSRHCIQDARWKLWNTGPEDSSHYGEVHLLDLDLDPGESRNVAEQEPDVLGRLSQVLDATMQEESALAQLLGPAPIRELDDETREQLKALGYL